jgi:ABC-type multidrug transport system fused ATPase/permease subunit
VKLHNRLLDAIMRLPSSFFDTNPSGRVINRFSRDTEIMDSVLPMSIMQVRMDSLSWRFVLRMRCAFPVCRLNG